MKEKVLLKTDFSGLRLFRRGKVRDVYDLGDTLLIVSTDRISCFDVVLSCGIPYKGKVLTGLSHFWFGLIKDISPHHFITCDIKEYPNQLKRYEPELLGRSMLVKKTKPLPVECVVRGYISGSGWREYRQAQAICGIKLPPGLRESDRLPEPIFTPSTKEDAGQHDVNVTSDYVEKTIGKSAADEIKRLSLEIYQKAAKFALDKGIIIADTKFEFGVYNNEIILIDEVLTPDSSRFWPLDEYSPGRPQASFDKQFVRDYLESLNWDKTPPAPKLPRDIIDKTSRKYLEAYRRITGSELQA